MLGGVSKLEQRFVSGGCTPSLSASMGAERLSAAPKLSQHLACSDRQSSGTGSPGPQAVSKA